MSDAATEPSWHKTAGTGARRPGQPPRWRLRTVGRGDIEHTEVAVPLGKNPWNSHGFPEARRVLNEIARDPNRSMVLIDPKRTTTAAMADFAVARACAHPAREVSLTSRPAPSLDNSDAPTGFLPCRSTRERSGSPFAS